MDGTGFNIDGKRIGAGQPTFIIAEIGINHGGSEEVAASMVRAAAEAGADAVKYQTVDAKDSYMPETASYREFAGKGLSLDAYRRLNELARSLGMASFSTPGDPASLRMMLASGMSAVKVSSGQMTNLPLLHDIGASRLPVILSTGMADLAEVERSVATLRRAGSVDIAVLQCTSLYPAPPETANLRAMAVLAGALGLPVGYSDHCLGILACVAAVAAGACIVEKHFSLDRTQAGADHHLSSEPDEFAKMVREIRLVEAMLGTSAKTPTAEEKRLRPGRERMLVTRRALAAGTILSALDFIAMRLSADQVGIPASQLQSLVGRRLKVAAGERAVLAHDMMEDS